MKLLFDEKPLKYDGSQLRSHFAYRQYGVEGDSIVSFMGPCQVDLTHMVDLEDVKNKKPIFSHSMVHFIVEHFEEDLKKTILHQYLLASLIQEDLNECLDQPESERVVRRGNDLYIGSDKLSVSIATSSPVSCLIHFGVNIESHDTPVPTRGLNDLGLQPQSFAQSVMNRYIAEVNSLKWARAKVRSVL